MMVAWMDHQVEVLRSSSEEKTEFANELVVGMYVKRKNLLSFCPEQPEEWEDAIYWDEKS